MFCGECGKELNPAAKFCRSCGAVTGHTGAAPPAAIDRAAAVGDNVAPVSRQASTRAQGSTALATAGPPGSGLQSNAVFLAIVLAVALMAGGFYVYRQFLGLPTDEEIVKSIQTTFARDSKLGKCAADLNAQGLQPSLVGAFQIAMAGCMARLRQNWHPSADPSHAKSPLMRAGLGQCVLLTRSQGRIVELSGRVASQEEKDAATRIAGQQRGVRQVNSTQLAVIDATTDPAGWMQQLVLLRSRQSPISLSSPEAGGATAAESFAAQLHVDIYPGAKAGQAHVVPLGMGDLTGGTAEFETTDPVNRVGEFYSSKYPNSRISGSAESDQEFSVKDDKAAATITVEKESGGQTLIQIAGSFRR